MDGSGESSPGGRRPRRRRIARRPAALPGAGTPPPPGVMWPVPGSGFEPSPYSPAGQLQQEAAAARHLAQDPIGVRRAIRASWGWPILVGGFAIVVLVALVAAALH